MSFQHQSLDLILVPAGLIIMFAYHLWLLYRRLYHPHTTVMGFENNDKKAWIDKVMQMDKKDIGTPVGVISGSISTATYLASISLTLCSLIGAWLANSVFQSNIVYGDRTVATMRIKYISLLITFLLAFTFFFQSMRSFVHATYLITIPDGNDIPNLTKYAEMAVINGDDYWNLGHRSLYFALVLLLWFLGPIPMFATSVVLVFHLHFLDKRTKPLLQHHPKFGKKAMNGGALVV